MNIHFGSITAAGYSSSPMNRKIQYDFEFGDRSGINIFMPEDAQHAAALERGEGEKLFTTG